MKEHKSIRTATHWGVFDVQVTDGRITQVAPYPGDPDPSPIGQNLLDAVTDKSRITQPMVREGWLRDGPRYDGEGRGKEAFVPVSWDRALDLVASEISRVKTEFGNEAIFGGSYGWASSGRFHHSLSQLHRFLKTVGGYTASANSYSTGTARVIVPHVVGHAFFDVMEQQTTMPVVAESTELLVMFGGIPLKNAQVNYSGMTRHLYRDWLQKTKDNGCRFVNISPLADDAAGFLDAEWLAVTPNTDTALMLAIAHTLVQEGLHDQAFMKRYTHGFDKFCEYLDGSADGQAKDAHWAAGICGLSADAILALARQMAKSRTLITVAWALQRGHHGEQPYWMAITLAALLGQIGLPGGGFGFGYGAEGAVGLPERTPYRPTFRQGENQVRTFIPVARIADMLLHPGEDFDYNGQRLTYPDIRLVYWSGGNPYHHHQDLNRLRRAWQRPETIIIQDPWWTATARHGDIVLPATTSLERRDISCSATDDVLHAMDPVIAPVGEARDDYDIMSGLAARMGVSETFTEGRSSEEWLRHMYDVFKQQAAQDGVEVPSYEEFWQAGEFTYPQGDGRYVLFEEFRNDPDGHPLPTPSGKIEIYSETIAGFGYDDCPGHPTWLEPHEWLGAKEAVRHPLHLISNQPETRLHSQLDSGATSRGGKVGGREPITLNPRDAAGRQILAGDIVRVFNDRGSCLAGAVISDTVRPGVVRLATGAWYDPDEDGLDRHGNPNVLTKDVPTSSLSQGTAAHTSLVEVELYDKPAPKVRAFEAPKLAT